MNKYEKVIEGLEYAIKFVNEFGDCNAPSGECPYGENVKDCHNRLMIDALALLKEQKNY